MKATFTIEFGDAHCRNFMFAPLKRRVRGRFSISTLMSREGGGPSPGEAMQGMPDVPGLHLDIDIQGKAYRLWDPLGDSGEDARRLRQRVEAVMDRAMIRPSDAGIEGVSEVEGKLNDDELKTMLLHARRMVDDKSASVVHGQIPTINAIEKLDGRELNDLWNMSAHKPKYREDQADYEQAILHSKG